MTREHASRSGRCPHCGATLIVPIAEILALDGRVCSKCGKALKVADVIHIHWGRLLCDACFAKAVAEAGKKFERSAACHTRSAVFDMRETARSASRRHTELECEVKLAEVLLRAGLLDPATLRGVTASQRKSGKSFVAAVVDADIASGRAIGAALAKETKLPFSTAKCQYVDRGVRQSLPISVMINYELVPLTRSADTITVAMVNPLDEEAIEEVERLTGLRVSPVICTLGSYRKTLARYFGVEETEGGGGGD